MNVKEKELELKAMAEAGAKRCLACFFYLCRCLKGLKEKDKRP
jgi:hypothetical protein